MNIPVRILIADSDVEFAVDLQEFLDQYDDLTVVQLTRDGVGTVNACRDMLPHVALIDLHLPVLDTVRAIETILAANPRLKILTLASQSADRYAVEAIKAGASGCLEKHIEKSAGPRGPSQSRRPTPKRSPNPDDPDPHDRFHTPFTPSSFGVHTKVVGCLS